MVEMVSQGFTSPRLQASQASGGSAADPRPDVALAQNTAFATAQNLRLSCHSLRQLIAMLLSTHPPAPSMGLLSANSRGH